MEVRTLLRYVNMAFRLSDKTTTKSKGTFYSGKTVHNLFILLDRKTLLRNVR